MTEDSKTDRRHLTTPGAQGPRWIPIPKWIRVSLGGEFVASSRRVMLLRGRPPVYYFPVEDVRTDLFIESSRSTQTQDLGETAFWDIQVGDRTAESSARQIVQPDDGSPDGISGYYAFEWDAVDSWWEEDEQIRVHPRDPYTRIDTRHSSRQIQVAIGGKTVAHSDRPVLLFETGLPVRYYLPKVDLNWDYVVPTDLKTECPYKGEASYYTVKVNGQKSVNIAWTYPFPNPGLGRIKGRVAFLTERLEQVTLDGQRLPD